MRTRYFMTTALAAMSCALSQPVLAQNGAAPPPEDAVFYVANGAAVMPFGGAVDVLRAEGSVPGEVVAGKPYSADSITESIQLLADGNRITSTHRARIYRDSEGRTRREQTLDGIGAWQTGSEPMTIITINDPVANVSYIVDPTTESVRRLPPFKLETGLQIGGQFEMLQQSGAPVMQGRLARPPGAVFNAPVNVTASWIAAAPLAATTDDLGEQVLQGVLAHGTRQTQTIPAGAIGNERPIDIVNEQWYSDELGALMLRTSTDPRFGVTAYRLINVDQSEPPAELFAPPQSYREIDPGPRTSVRTLDTAPSGEAGRRIVVIHEGNDDGP